MTPIRKSLLEILDSQTFDRLEPFKKSEVWHAFTDDDKNLFARLLVMHGAVQLAQGNQQALQSFEYAAQVSLQNPEILYQQGSILSSYRDNIRCLNLASQSLTKALEKDPQFCRGWILQSQILFDIGLFEGESSYFIEADRCFEKAFQLLDEVDSAISDAPIVKEEFFWKWGICLASLGKTSGEPLDFHRAIEKFRYAQELGCFDQKFLNDFGCSLIELGELIEKSDCFSEALLLFNQATRQAPDVFEGWYNQACCFQSLIDFKGDSKWIEQADNSFIKAIELHPNSSQAWLKWGQLDMAVGRIKHDPQLLEGSFLKFERALQLEPDHPEILSHWAESELCLGAQEERLDLIQSARQKILMSLEIQPEDPMLWYLYGSCLNELGSYFSDEDYFNQAIEKFQYGLSLSRHNPLLWYGQALAHFALGELTEQQALFEKSARYYSRVIECGGEGFPQFWNDWGLALLKLGEMTQQANLIEMAIEKFEKALKQPLEAIEGEDIDLEWIYNFSCAYDLLGDLQEEPHHFEKAVQIFTQILQLDPHYIMARYNLALALSHLGEAMYDVEYYHKAIEQYQILLEQDSENDLFYLDYGMSLTNLGLLVHDVHHPEQSQTLYRQAENNLLQAATLGNMQAYYQLAGLYSITDHYEQAMHYLEKAQFCGTLPGVEDLLHDEWLEGVRKTHAFRHFINEISSRQSTEDK